MSRPARIQGSGFLSLCLLGPLAALVALALAASSAFAHGHRPLVISFQGDAATLDAQGRNETTTISIQSHIFDFLIKVGVDGRLEPDLALSWRPVTETLWRFKLRKGVRFHNGEPFDASVAAYSLWRAKTWKLSQMKHFTVGVQKVRAVDEETLEIDTGKPHPSLPLEISSIAIVPPKYIQEKGDKHFALNPVGTGAYRFVRWAKDDHIRLTANPNYYKGAPPVREVVIRPIPEDAARAAGLLTGELDVVWGLGPVDGKKLQGDPRVRIYRAPTQRTIYMAFDLWRLFGGPYKPDGEFSPGLPPGAPNPFLDLRVRQAVYHAVDIEEIIAKVMHGSGRPNTQFITSASFGFNPQVKRLPYNPERARQLLAEAGYPEGFEVRLDCASDRYINDRELCEAVGGMLTRVGIRTTPNPRPKAVFFPRLDRGDFTVYVAGWGTQAVGSSMNTLFHCRDLEKGYGRINRYRYCNQAVDKLIGLANATMDDKKREALWHRAIAIAMGEVAWVPLHQQEAIIGTSPKVKMVPRFNEWVLAQEITWEK